MQIDDDCTEAEALDEALDARDDAPRIDTSPDLYNIAKQRPVGQVCVCPHCRQTFTKKTYQQAFCSNKGRGNCKDAYWNRATPQRLSRAKLFHR